MSEPTNRRIVPPPMEASGPLQPRRADAVPSEESESSLHHFLAGRDVKCPTCAYNLRDLASAECPECGTQLVLRLGRPVELFPSWVVGIVGLSASLGLSILILGWLLLVVVWSMQVDAEYARRIAWCAGVSTGFILLIRAWCRQREVFHGLKRDVRAALATACVGSFPVSIFLHLAMSAIL